MEGASDMVEKYCQFRTGGDSGITQIRSVVNIVLFS